MKKMNLIFVILILFLSACSTTKLENLDNERLPSSIASCDDLVSGFIQPSKKVSVAGSKSKKETAELFNQFQTDAKAFYSTSGFKNSNELIEKAKSKSALNALNLLQKEELEIAMAAPSKNRELIAEKGFSNFRESGHSEGATGSREIVESDYAGMDINDYEKLDPALKPKYAYVAPKQGSGLKEPEGVASYGDDKFIFDLEKIRDQITFTVGDSLNRHYLYHGLTSESHKADSWDQRFMPWNFRELAAPAIAESVEKSKKLGIEMDTFVMTADEFNAEYPPQAAKHFITMTTAPNDQTPVKWAPMEIGVNPPSDWSQYKIPWGSSLDYIEIQIWDRINLDAVKAFEYTKTPPTGKFLAELKRRGIKIIDGRKK